MTKEQSQTLLSLVMPISSLRFSPERAEAWFSNGFDEIVLCQYRLNARAHCDADVLTVRFLKTDDGWSAGAVEKPICVN